MCAPPPSPLGRQVSMMSNLPKELLEDILSRVPITSLRRVRSTCKKWNTLSKNGNFTKKHLAQVAASSNGREFLATLTMNCSLYLMSVSLYRIHNDFDPSIRRIGKLISLDDSDQVPISRVCYCEGLLLCTTEAYTRLVVWNPYSGQTRWIPVEPTSVPYRKLWYVHALGYDKDKSQKVLRFAHLHLERYVYEIFELKSNSWRVLDITLDKEVEYDNFGVSLKGNTYWYATNKNPLVNIPHFLLCFDFTTERFVPRLRLPTWDTPVTLSSVREEQLAVLFQNSSTFEMEIWVTTNIDPNAVSWSKFLAVDMGPLTGFRFSTNGSFLIDEETRAVVVFDEDKDVSKTKRNTAYIIGEDGYYKEVDLGKITTGKEGFPHACSYIPSSVQINQPA